MTAKTQEAIGERLIDRQRAVIARHMGRFLMPLTTEDEQAIIARYTRQEDDPPSDRVQSILDRYLGRSRPERGTHVRIDDREREKRVRIREPERGVHGRVGD